MVVPFLPCGSRCVSCKASTRVLIRVKRAIGPFAPGAAETTPGTVQVTPSRSFFAQYLGVHVVLELLHAREAPEAALTRRCQGFPFLA